jgi:DNA-binding MarR family transcriptional regulator
MPVPKLTKDGADLGILLTLALRGFVDQLHDGLEARGFSDVRPAFGVIFRALRDEPLTLTDLAARLGVSKQAASKVIDEMEAKRLVRRTASRTDGRAKLLALTPRGRDAMAHAIALGVEIDARLREAAGSPKVDTMHQVLEHLVVLAGLGDDLASRRSPALWDESQGARS